MFSPPSVALRRSTGPATVRRVPLARMRDVPGADDHLLQLADLPHRLDQLVHVRQRRQHVALDFALVLPADDPEAAILTPPAAPRVDGELKEARGVTIADFNV